MVKPAPCMGQAQRKSAKSLEQHIGAQQTTDCSCAMIQALQGLYPLPSLNSVAGQTMGGSFGKATFLRLLRSKGFQDLQSDPFEVVK